MSDWIAVRNKSRGSSLLTRVKWCESFFCKLRGLMFRRRLPVDEGLLLVEGRESRSSTAIHMLFVFSPIGVIWLDGDFRVVDVTIAKPWRPLYVPSAPAKYILEVDPSVLESLGEGEVLELEYE